MYLAQQIQQAKAAMSEPSSPLLTQAPKWLRQTSRNVVNARYVVKMLLLAGVCVFLGVSVSNLYDSGISQQTGKLISTGENAPYLQELRKKPYYHEIDLTRNESFTKEVSPTSMLQRLRHKIQSLTPWSSMSDTLTCSSSYDTNLTTAANGSISEIITTPLDPISPPLLAKVTIMFGKPSPAYERALRTHNAHNRLHDYTMNVLRENMMEDVWSKPAYILSCLLRELAKPPHERLKWLFWVDADTIIINPYVPLETFLPPQTSEWSDVHLLVTHDWNGLNNGIFPVRVCDWSVKLFSAIIAYPEYNPEKELVFRDQSAMGALLETPRFSRHAVVVPQRWFNAYQGEIEETIAPYQTRPGDLLVHFAGVGAREARMEWWLERAEQHLPEWEVDFKHTTVKADVSTFFKSESAQRNARKAEAGEFRDEWRRRQKLLQQVRGMDGDEGFDQRIETAIKRVDRWIWDEAYDDQPKFLLDMMGQEEVFMRAGQQLALAMPDLLVSAQEELSNVATAIFSLDLQEWGARNSHTEEALGKLEASMRRMRLMLHSNIVQDLEVSEYLRNMTKSQSDLRDRVRDATSDGTWDFPAVNDIKAKEAEQARLRELMRTQLEAEVEGKVEAQIEEKLREAAANAQKSNGTKIASNSTIDDSRGAREAANKVFTPDAIVAMPGDGLTDGAPDKQEEDKDKDKEMEDFGSDTADTTPKTKGKTPKPAGAGFLPNKASVKLDTVEEEETGSSKNQPVQRDTAQPTAEDIEEIPDRETWWIEEGQYSEGALEELREEQFQKLKNMKLKAEEMQPPVWTQPDEVDPWDEARKRRIPLLRDGDT